MKERERNIEMEKPTQTTTRKLNLYFGSEHFSVVTNRKTTMEISRRMKEKKNSDTKQEHFHNELLSFSLIVTFLSLTVCVCVAVVTVSLEVNTVK